MAKTRPGRLYKRIKSQSYTRRKYMGGVPGSRISQFDLGDKTTNFPIVASLVVDERVAITHNALESARVAANRVLMKYCGATGYHLKLRVYPHEVLRENKQASGAGADRVSQGMRRSFGKAVGVAARLQRGQELMTARVRPEHWPAVKEAFRKANMKLPTPTHLQLEKGEDQVRLFLEGKIKAAKAIAPPPKEKKEEAPAAEGAAPAEGAKPDAKGAKPDAKAGAKPEAKPAAGGDKKPAKK
ncbi:MAG TPA: 50S ribosomal protein L16 [Candidatus Thermoplasmatota archaeon]|nr:50S ribosomal protein L16 [Candidatus Thermoplasmatota archaeon]